LRGVDLPPYDRNPSSLGRITRIIRGRVQPLIFPMVVAGEHKAAVAIAAFDEMGLAHLQIDAGMAQRAAAAIAQTPI
jgi:hypothetical protein